MAVVSDSYETKKKGYKILFENRGVYVWVLYCMDV